MLKGVQIHFWCGYTMIRFLTPQKAKLRLFLLQRNQRAGKFGNTQGMEGRGETRVSEKFEVMHQKRKKYGIK